MGKCFETGYHKWRKWSVFLVIVTAAARSVHTATGNEKVASAAASTRLYWPPGGAGVDRILSTLCLIDKKRILLHKVYKCSPCHTCSFFLKCNGKKVFYLLRSMHFKSFKNKQKEFLLKHKDQRELISFHGHFFRCFYSAVLFSSSSFKNGAQDEKAICI